MEWDNTPSILTIYPLIIIYRNGAQSLGEPTSVITWAKVPLWEKTKTTHNIFELTQTPKISSPNLIADTEEITIFVGIKKQMQELIGRANKFKTLRKP